MNRRWPFILVGILVLFVAMFAPFMTLLAWLTNSTVWLFLLVALVISVPAFFSFWYTLNNSTNMPVRWVWMQALGLGTVLLSLVALASVLTLFISPKIVGSLILFAWIGLSAYAAWKAINIKTNHLQFSAPQLAKNLRLIQISDVHIGSRSANFLTKVVAQVNAEQPDIVVITGDLLDSSSVGEHELSALKNLSCPAYMCIGNHERYVNLDKALSAIKANGVTVLRDTTTTLDGIQLIGIDDRDLPTDLPSLLNDFAIDTSCYSVLLYHRPDGWEAALEHDIQLTLSGHTHAGQMFPFGLLVKRRYPNMVGHFSKNGKSLYVSIGTGTWGPIFRLGTHSEISIFDLKADSKN